MPGGLGAGCPAATIFGSFGSFFRVFPRHHTIADSKATITVDPWHRGKNGDAFLRHSFTAGFGAMFFPADMQKGGERWGYYSTIRAQQHPGKKEIQPHPFNSTSGLSDASLLQLRNNWHHIGLEPIWDHLMKEKWVHFNSHLHEIFLVFWRKGVTFVGKWR